MQVIKMNPDKSLSVTKRVTNYLGENNAEEVLFLLLTTYNGNDLKSCNIVLNILNQDKVGNMIAITPLSELYSGFIQYKMDIPNEWTYKAGNIEFWFTFTNNDELVVKTGSAFLTITSRNEVVDYIPDQDLELLTQWTVLMNKTYEDAEQAVSNATEQAELAKGYADTASEIIASIPTAGANTLGLIKVGNNLKIDTNGVLSVDTATNVEQDNTKPVTSAAVHTQLGNIEALLATI
jgi:hypothetical protein